MIRQAAGHLREVVVVAGSHPCDRSLEEVAEAVQLMPRLKVGVPRGLPGAPEAGVQVAVGFLGGGDPRHQGVVAALEVIGVVAASSQAMASRSL